MSSKLTMWILVAAVAGVLAGWAGHELSPDAAAAASIAGSFSILSDVFLRLIKMIIAPLVFATVVAGIAGAGDAKAVGRIGGKAILWFVSASLLSLLLGMLFANLLGPGRDLALPLPDRDAATNLKTGGLNLREFITHVFPRSFFEAMAANEILQILVFSCFFGFALASLRSEPAATVKAFVADLVPVMLKVTDFVMWAAPAGVFGAIASAITRAGPGRARHLRQVHRLVLPRAARAVGRAHRRRFPGPGSDRAAADAPGEGAVDGGVRHGQQRGRLSQADGAAAPLRRQRPDHLVRAAAGLLLQPRRLDALPGLRRAVHRAGLRHRPVRRGSSSRCCW